MGWLTRLLAAEQGRLLPWGAVALGMGAALWFVWPFVTWPWAVAAGGVALLGAGVMWVRHPVARVFGGAILALGAGFALAEIRNHWVAAPVLGFRYYGPIEGRVVDIDRSGTDRLRLTLEEIRLENVAPDRLPQRVRISLQQEQPHLDLHAGLRVMTTGHLSPPEGAIEPGGFDFQRFAWFRSLGAVGYSRGPVLAVAPAGPWDQGVTRLRMWLSGGIQARISGEAGAFAAAMMTGDRSGMGPEAVGHLRDSNLYHLVSISGVHMSLLAGFVFLGLRSLMALIPPLVLRWPVHKVAALLALAVSAFYLVLAGGDVATTRAFVMVAVMLGAVLADRRALSLRSVALAALVLMIWRPESVLDPGFQMSFAATAALVVGMGALTPVVFRWPWWARGAAFSLAASLLAGTASAPFAAVHFNRYAEFGLVANLLASPIMAFVVMPAGALAAVLAPIGLGAPALWVLGWGCEALLQIAAFVAGWSGAVRLIAAPDAAVLPLVGLGFILLILLRGRARGIGILGLMLAAALWAQSPRPEVLIASDASLIGVMTPQGRALSKPRGGGFSARGWLESDGDGASQKAAAQRSPFGPVTGAAVYQLGGTSLAHLHGSKARQKWRLACETYDIVVIPQQIPADGNLPCLLIDLNSLRSTGAVSVSGATTGALTLTKAQQAHRPWVRARHLAAMPPKPKAPAPMAKVQP